MSTLQVNNITGLSVGGLPDGVAMSERQRQRMVYPALGRS